MALFIIMWFKLETAILRALRLCVGIICLLLGPLLTGAGLVDYLCLFLRDSQTSVDSSAMKSLTNPIRSVQT